MKVVGYAYPWDVRAPGAVARICELGVDEVAVAVACHSARAATPWSTTSTAVHARHAAFYRPLRGPVWGDIPLRPAVPDWVPAPDSAGDAVRLLAAAGVRTAAWIVLTHSTLLGSTHPEVAVRNCFGETYPWALCPAQPAVRAYAAALTGESLAGLPFASVVLEACGPLGVVHQHQHEKTDGVWAPAAARLLSVCCCASCAAGWSAAGLDPDDVRARLSTEVRRIIATGDPALTEDELDRTVAAAVLATRQQAVDALRAAVLADVPAGLHVALHGALDPWATGALPGLTPAAAADVDVVVLQNWTPGPAGADAVAAARAQLPDRVAVGSYVTAVAAAAVPDMAAHVAALGRAGAGELHLYHLGLAGPARWGDIRAAVRAAGTVPPRR